MYENVALVGAGLRVPLATGSDVRYLNLDYAATTPCAEPVRNAVEEILPWYASVHRGDGYSSAVCTELQELCRQSVRQFTGARTDDAVVFTRHTTDSLNLLAHCLPDDCVVLAFATEHHANLLPWARREVRYLPVPDSPEHAQELLAAALAKEGGGNRLVALAAASNVTGEVWPVAELARIARRHGARVAVDAAQIAAHQPIDMSGWDVDYLAFSGHKLYAPYGSGVLVGRPDWLDDAAPYLAGGGATRQVTVHPAAAAGDPSHAVAWAESPHRHEAGSPNFVGNYALATACELLYEPLRSGLVAREEHLTARLERALAGIPGVRTYRMWDADRPKVAIVTFSVQGWEPGMLSAALSAEYGIGVRNGLFCAHPLAQHLLAGDAGSAVRASLGLGVTEEDVDRCVRAVAQLVTRGAARTYRTRGARYVPDGDRRELPVLRHGPRALRQRDRLSGYRVPLPAASPEAAALSSRGCGG